MISNEEAEKILREVWGSESIVQQFLEEVIHESIIDGSMQISKELLDKKLAAVIKKREIQSKKSGR